MSAPPKNISTDSNTKNIKKLQLTFRGTSVFYPVPDPASQSVPPNGTLRFSPFLTLAPSNPVSRFCPSPLSSAGTRGTFCTSRSLKLCLLTLLTYLLCRLSLRAVG